MRSERTPLGSLDETTAAYDVGAEIYEQRYEQVDVRTYLRRFILSLPSGCESVLDAGCGSGRDLAQFASAGVRSIGLDRSRGMLSVAQGRGSRTPLVRGDLRHLPFRNEALRGVWQCASLVHLAPADVCKALCEVRRTLVRGGKFFLSVAHGQGQEWRPGALGNRRWFQYYQRGDIECLVEQAGLRVTWSAVERGAAHGIWINVFGERSREDSSRGGGA
jgi:SAM-dependent methyltransferase